MSLFKLKVNEDCSMPWPEYLYKVLSKEDWELSLTGERVRPGVIDTAFIHLALPEQIDGVLGKFWHHVPEVRLLKLDPTLLKGRLILEKNPGGKNAYWHLYDGFIPQQAVVESILWPTSQLFLK